MAASDVVIRLRTICGTLDLAGADSQPPLAEEDLPDASDLVAAFHISWPGDPVVAYQVARLMDFAGAQEHALAALQTIAASHPDVACIQDRLQAIREEFAWENATGLPRSPLCPPTALPSLSASQEALSDLPERPAPRAHVSHVAPYPPAPCHPMTDAYRQLRDPNRLWDAWRKVAAKEGAPGADGITVPGFASHVVQHFQSIARELATGEYRFGQPAVFEITKASGGRLRLTVPCVRDRVLLTNAAAILQEHYETLFSDASFGYRPGRSVQLAVAEVRRLAPTHPWVVDADIAGCFDNIPHSVLLDRLTDHVADNAFLSFVTAALRALAYDETPDHGIPQGSPFSPVLCNIHLDALDKAAENRGIPLVRYADDFLLLLPSQGDAQEALTWCDEFIRTELGLELSTTKTRIAHLTDGLNFLGQDIRISGGELL